MKSFSYITRNENIFNLSNQNYDVVVIGGGINGAGIARDAASRGMKVALIEAFDFASGTSSRSSKLIHGGIRYLENLEFKLVFEALAERQKLFEIAANLVHPLRFNLPIYKNGRFGMFELGLGMWLYDALSLFEAPEPFEKLSASETIANIPILKGENLLGSYLYSDAYMDDDRLVLETLRSANELGAVCVNYVEAKSMIAATNGKISGITCTDQITKKSITIHAKHVISAVGPWTDDLAARLDHNWKKMLRPTKGVHLTFEKKRLNIKTAVVMGAEKRIVFAIPRHEMVIIGTTDTDYCGDPKNVCATKEDITYLLQVANEYFPGSKLEEKDIIASYAGIRPLVQDQAESEGKTSREHSIFSTDAGVTFVAGGKYTTYRLIAEQTIEEALNFFTLEERIKFNRNNTVVPLNKYVSLETQMQKDIRSEEIRQLTRWQLHDCEKFFDRHGLESFQIINKFGSHHSLVQLEALHAIENTMCINLVDFYFRRLPLFLSQKDHGLSNINELADIFSKRLYWSEDRKKQEIIALQEQMQHELRWRIAP